MHDKSTLEAIAIAAIGLLQAFDEEKPPYLSSTQPHSQKMSTKLSLHLDQIAKRKHRALLDLHRKTNQRYLKAKNRGLNPSRGERSACEQLRNSLLQDLAPELKEIRELSRETCNFSKLLMPGKRIDAIQPMTAFRGRINIQDGLEAMSYALNRSLLTPAEEGRLIVWTDASTPSNKDCGLAIVTQAKKIVDWGVQGYTVSQSLRSDEAEAFAIAQAMQLKDMPSLRAMVDRQAVSALEIFTDSQAALHNIDYGLGGSLLNKDIMGMIFTRAEVLKNRGIEVILNWVPGHKGIPGNELADLVARRAAAHEYSADVSRPQRPSLEYRTERRALKKAKRRGEVARKQVNARILPVQEDILLYRLQALCP